MATKTPRPKKPKQSLSPSFINRKSVLIGLVIYLGFLWSWVFFIDIARLSKSVFTGFLLATMAYVLIVAVATTIMYVTILWLRPSRQKNTGSVWYLLKIICVWAFAEWLAALAIALLWKGKQGSWDTVIPFSSLTIFLIRTPLADISRYVGFYGVSAVAVGVAASVVIRPLRKFCLPLIATVVALTVSGALFYARASGPSLLVATRAEHLGDRQRIATSADLLVAPEYAFDTIESTQVTDRVQGSHNQPVYFVGSQQLIEGNTYKNILVYGSTDSGYSVREGKNRLIPGGEYLPYSVDFLLHAFRANDTLAAFNTSRAVAKSNEPLEPIHMTSGIVLGSAVCSSIISTEDYRKLVNDGATILTNSASLEVFANNPIFNLQHRSLAKFMAIANSRPFVQSSNDNTAFIMDNSGTYLAFARPTETISSRVVTNSRKTPYSILGEWVAIAGGIFTVYSLVRHIKNHRITAKPNTRQRLHKVN